MARNIGEHRLGAPKEPDDEEEEQPEIKPAKKLPSKLPARKPKPAPEPEPEEEELADTEEDTPIPDEEPPEETSQMNKMFGIKSKPKPQPQAQPQVSMPAPKQMMPPQQPRLQRTQQPMQEPVKEDYGYQNPQMSDKSQSIMKMMHGSKPFVVDADAYGKAIAESIITQSTANKDWKVDFDGEMRKRIEFRGGSYGLVYNQGKIPVRCVPFVWQLDQSTRKTWAVFTFNNFYGHKPSNVIMFWKRMWTTLVITPFNKSSDITDGYRGGYLAKFDEDTQFQMDIHKGDDSLDQKNRIDNKNFISAGLQLWQDLNAYTKPKFNMRLVIYLVVGIALVVLGYWYISTHPALLGGLSGFLHAPGS